jgi:hypothetical protein
MAVATISESSTTSTQVTLLSQSSSTVGSTAEVSNISTILEESGGLSVQAPGSNPLGPTESVVNNGIIKLSNTADLPSSVDTSSSGTYQLTFGGTVEIDTPLGPNAKIQFLASNPANELIIDHAANFGLNVGTASYAGPLLEGFIAGDTIDLKDVAPTGVLLDYSGVSGDLQITGGTGAEHATLSFQSSTLGTGSFHAASDGSGGTLITHS